ncbi:MAG: sugar phosphate isomerase/epimerase, partial [Pirellulaceae bacterium]
MIVQQRRSFLVQSTAGLVGLGLTSHSPWLTQPATAAPIQKEKLPFSISLAQWSLHKMLFGGKLDNRDFAKFTKERFGIDAIEYVNQFFKDKAKDNAYIDDLKKRADDLGVKTLLIMID